MGGSLIRDRLKSAAAKIDGDLKLLRRELTELDGAQVAVAVELVEAGVRVHLQAAREAIDLKVFNIELTLVNFNLVLEGVVTDTGAGISDLLHNLRDLRAVALQAEHEIAGDCSILVGGQVLVVELRDLVHVAQLAEGTEEVIGRDGHLALEERKPENLCALGLEGLADLVGEIIIHNVLEVDLVEIISPWVQHGEALVLDALLAVLLDVFLEELEVSLVSVDWVVEFVSVDWLLLVTNERANGLDARA